MKSDSDRGESKSQKRYYDRRDNHSQSCSWRDIECYYYHKKGHIGRNCEELTKHLEEKRKEEAKEASDSANIIKENLEKDDNFYSVAADEKSFDV